MTMVMTGRRFTSPEDAVTAAVDAHFDGNCGPACPCRTYAPTVTGLPGSLPAMLEDRNAEHQIVLAYIEHDIAVACTCQLGSRHRPHEIIEQRPVFPATAALAVWRAWHRKDGITV